MYRPAAVFFAKSRRARGSPAPPPAEGRIKALGIGAGALTAPEKLRYNAILQGSTLEQRHFGRIHHMGRFARVPCV